MIEVFSFFNTPYLMAPPIGPQIGKAAKKVGQNNFPNMVTMLFAK